MDLFLLPQPTLIQRAAENSLGRGVEIDAKPGNIQQTRRVISLYDPEVVRPVQHRYGKRALQLLRHKLQRVKIQRALLFQQLRGNIGIRLNLTVRELELPLKKLVAAQNAIVRQREGQLSGHAAKRVVVIVPLGVFLRSHAGVARDHRRIQRDEDAQLMGRHRFFVDAEPSAGIVGDPGGVSPSCFTLSCQNR